MHLLSIDDLTDADIDWVLDRAEDHRTAAAEGVSSPRLVGLLFGQTSLRTQVGYYAAAARLGWNAIPVPGRRGDATSMSESWEDTLRTLSGYLEVLVARPGEPLSRESLRESLAIPYVNGGGVGPEAEHPTQSLIDLYAIQRTHGSPTELTIAICGDLRMRAARSLLKLLARRPPRRLILVTSELMPFDVPPSLTATTERRALDDLPSDLDILYVVGIPHQAIPESARDTLRVTEPVLERLSQDAQVLSPLPLIDEIEASARRDHRVRFFEQSDNALFVRMAVLELIVAGRT